VILHWLAPPELLPNDLRRRARSLWIASWPFFVGVTAVLGIAVLVEPETMVRRATTVAAVGVLVAILHAISHTGRPVLASWMLVIGLSAIVTQRAWITGGIHAPVAVFYALFVVMAGVLIGTRGALVTASACLLGAIILTFGTSFRWLAPRPGAGSPLGGFVFVVLSISLALVVQWLVTDKSRRDGLSADAVKMLVHDMRSPIHLALAHLDVLRDDVGGKDVRHIDEAVGGVIELRRMTNSLLDVGRLESGRMPVRRSVTDLAMLAQSTVSVFRVLQPARDIAVESSGDSACHCDPELTRRIIENLVSNAMKHTEIAERVRVIISGSTDSLRIAVHDEGAGVPQENKTRIFEPYNAQGLRSAAGFESSGLGLAFCKLAVEAQGGSIRIEERTPRGTAFIVELPR
jgi:signal transduction histidine kinase